jgi:hypothetical protein
LSISEAKADDDARAIMDSLLPDNDNFTASDATDWERRLRLITKESVSLSDRKLAITRKMNHPGTVPARSSYRFIQKQLRDAGFDVYVYENRFWDGSEYVTMTPEEITGDVPPEVQHADGQHGDFQHGDGIWNIVANYIDESLDFSFNIGENLRFTFFISGPLIDTYADVDEDRKNEFRQLILKVKPTNTVAYLFVNYI